MEIYDLLRIVIMIVIAIVFLVSVTLYLIRGDAPSLSGVEKQIKTSFCNSDADCSGGVCVSSECICFLDSQCGTGGKCDMGTGMCKHYA